MKPIQVFEQIKTRLSTPKLKLREAPAIGKFLQMEKPISKNKCYLGNGQFCFINIKDSFTEWTNRKNGNLWAFNLNYMDWLQQSDISDKEICFWIDKYIESMLTNDIGNDPYPTALRCMNWIRLFIQAPEFRTTERENALYSQCRLLEKRLEYKLLGNHLLEEGYALLMASVYFKDNRMYRRASSLVKKQLNEQILADGAHYEQSPMYHCILLDRLLDVINVLMNNGIREKEDIEYLSMYAEQMLGHLESISWSDGSIPLLNDSANGIAPVPVLILDYAKRLGLKWETIPMKECGYRKMVKGQMEAIMDVGNITAYYQPGHTHADVFHYELRINGTPFVVDTGISTYNKNVRRQYERSTAAHNTVVIDGENSYEVWGGFRVGRRTLVCINSEEKECVRACYKTVRNKNRHQRIFKMYENTFEVDDEISSGKAVGYIHLAPDVKAELQGNLIMTEKAVVLINGAEQIELKKEKVSTEYNHLQESTVIVITFLKKMNYIIQVV